VTCLNFVKYLIIKLYFHILCLQKYIDFFKKKIVLTVIFVHLGLEVRGIVIS